MPDAVREAASEWLSNPTEINLAARVKSQQDGDDGNGEGGGANISNVIQTVHVCAEHKKPRKLLQHIERVRKEDGRTKARILIFANRIKTVRCVRLMQLFRNIAT